ncbi:type III secretion system effector XopH [Xanthomonas graminis]|uniref:Tyrosine phosphatase n=1 Tax=Xanthomonas graminis pv. arrhenatheri LMG 727 TaxID=1195923 RepID=A0A0K2ZJU2_9XANT|nr:type III secretion system effector XopH [Xanthomonas translucens]UKE77449.1 tyrosine protein phosphatase [Xanthomonas translucens pv. arrhenatheri]CTP85237.1 tyrosine phosphatase [Xanthomonas translucens pv. arrhenatheri LMG 727]
MPNPISGSRASSVSGKESDDADLALDIKQKSILNPVNQSIPTELGGLAPRANKARYSSLIKKFSDPLPLPQRPTAIPIFQYDRSPRSSSDNFRSSDGFDLPESCNPTGWEDLHVSGSGSIASIGQIARLNPSRESPVIVLDVREESHAIVGGYPATWRAPNNWANVGKSREEVLADEHERILAIKSQETVQILHRKDVKNDVPNPRSVTLSKPSIFSEEELVRNAGAEYLRLTVTDHLGPRAEDIDAFVAMERNMAPHERLHVHCGVGQGRTGIFIAMHDMLRNAHTISFEDIIKRQLAFNPGRALDFHKDVSHEGRSDFRNDRLEFISLFYEYAKSNPKGQPSLWSEWLNNHSK